MQSNEALVNALQKNFGFSRFRPHQEEVCGAAAQGDDLLLVMPTGAGKSLCYQLPGLVRGGTTVVISPLIALMDDQASKLRALGLRAEALHSGRDRDVSRQICRDYLMGTLHFLFIAPERLSVPGFPEMLLKRRPSLIAVDEAHCISQWGHDFRPDYRMLKDRLPLFRPTPVVALTATATAQVQGDIVEQLGILNARRFIHGFRRSNLGIEIVRLGRDQRNDAVQSLLRASDRRPAIVYTPTRNDAETLATKLNRSYPSAAYHAGLDAAKREKIQNLFLNGKLEVIIATVAFGMGIDKADVRTVIHTSLPGSVESYYQEIGRAGRDGLPSRAVLLQSDEDSARHAYFFKRDYPEVSLLAQVVSKLKSTPRTREELWNTLVDSLDSTEFEAALKQLKIHGGIRVNGFGPIETGDPAWRDRYLAQRKHKLSLCSQMDRFAESRGCRMIELIRYFGDTQDMGRPCGVCDICAPRARLMTQSTSKFKSFPKRPPVVRKRSKSGRRSRVVKSKK